MGRGRRRKAQPTDEWQELLPLFEWPEQGAYEELRPLVLFGSSVAERARETGTPERTMYRRVERFEEDGMMSLFATDPATARDRRRGLEPAIRRMIVELKAEHPRLNNNEIANIVYVRTGRRLGRHTPGRVLAEEVVPLKLSRLFEPYHEAPDRRESREAVVGLHLDGWSAKAIASYMRVSRTTVYRVFGRWIEEGDAGFEDRSPGRPKGVRAVGRVMAVHRDLYGFGKPKRSPREKAEMPFRAKRRHEIWTADVRYVPHSIPGTGNAYVIAVLENYSRCVLASSVSLTQDTAAFLRVFYSAVERYGSPERLVTDGGGIFKAKQSKAVYRALGITKEQIERRKPYQSYIETTFGIQKRMADWHFARAETFPQLAEAHDSWREDYNAQRHWAHEGREDGRRSPQDVLGFYTALLRHREEDLRRAFFSTRSTRVLDALGYARFLDWRLYGEEALPRREVAVWLQPESLTLEYGGRPLSSYDVEISPETGKPKTVGDARLFGTSHVLPQLRLFALDDAGWLKALKLERYAPRRPSGPIPLQEVLFPYLEAL